MGNVNTVLKESKNKIWTNLSHEKMKEIHEQILYEYPFLTNVYESMLVTDNTQPDCPIVFANDQFEQMTLYSKEEILGRNCRFLQGKYTDRNLVKRIREAVDTGKALDVEILNYRKDGVAFWNSFIMLPVHEKKKKSGRVTHFIAIQKDVTVLKGINENPTRWSPPEVAMWMEHNGLSEYAPAIVDKAIDGPKLLSMDRSSLTNLGIMPVTEHKRFLQLISDLKGSDTKLVRIGSSKSLKSSSSEYTTTMVNGSPLNSETINGKDYWNHSPTTEKIVFKCFVDGREPWCILAENDITLAQLEKRIQKAFGNFKIQYKEDDMVMGLETDDDLRNVLDMLQGQTIPLYLDRISTRLPKSSTALMEDLPVPILFADAGGYIIFANKESLKLFGEEKKKHVVGKHFSQLMGNSLKSLPSSIGKETVQATMIRKNGGFAKCELVVHNNGLGQYSMTFLNVQEK